MEWLHFKEYKKGGLGETGNKGREGLGWGERKNSYEAEATAS